MSISTEQKPWTAGELPEWAKQSFADTPVEDFNHTFRPVPHLSESAKVLNEALVAAKIRAINLNPEAVSTELFGFSFTLGKSDKSAVSARNLGTHLIFSTEQSGDPSPDQIANIVAGLSDAALGVSRKGHFRMEINFGQNRSRPHFHIHVILANPINAPWGKDIHHGTEENGIVKTTSNEEIRLIKLEQSATGSIYKATKNLLPHLSEDAIPGQEAPTSRFIVSSYEGRTVVACLEGTTEKRSVDSWM